MEKVYDLISKIVMDKAQMTTETRMNQMAHEGQDAAGLCSDNLVGVG